jgi:DNA-binding TFAR19-related protein (PDSD5 family)
MKSELDELRRKKLGELQRAYEQQGQEQAEVQQQVEQVESFVKAHLSREALQRYSNLKIAFPDMAMQLLGVLAQSIQNYNIKEISDAQLKELLQRVSPKKRDIKIKFERK